MPLNVLNTIEYLVLIVSEFANRNRISEAEAYAYLNNYGAITLCERHYGIMHTLSVEENIESLVEYCRRRGGRDMRMYHGSNVQIESADLSLSKPNKDFGRAFYLSPDLEQAEEMAAVRLKKV